MWEATRARVATDGFGARLLAHQDPDGQWAGGAYFPAGSGGQGEGERGQPWTATTWSLVALREWGLDPAVLREWAEGSTRSSFHSTLNALDGLLDHEIATGGTDATRAARRGGEDYLLERRLTRRLSTGEPPGPWVSHFAYPSRWLYSALRAADHVRRASEVDGTAPDPRTAEAVELLRAARQPDGTWLQGGRLPGDQWFEVDAPAGEPSRG